MSKDRLIGSGDGLPWKIEEEYQQYLSYIEGHTVIMGRRSFIIFGDELTSRHNLVVSRSLKYARNAIIFREFKAALDYARELPGKIFIAGGTSIYNMALPLADAMYLSLIRGKFEGDHYFPAYNPKLWKICKRILHPRFDFMECRKE